MPLFIASSGILKEMKCMMSTLSLLDPRFGNFRSTMYAEMKRLHGMALGVFKKQAELCMQSHLMRQKASLVPTMPRYSPTLIERCLLYEAMMSIATFNVSSLLRKSMRTRGCTYSTQTMEIRVTEVHIKVDPKVLRQYEDTSDREHCVGNIFVKYLHYLLQDVDYFYCRPLP